VSGSAQSLGLGAGDSPVCYADGPNNAKYLRFVTGYDFLQTPGLAGVSGTAPLVLSFVMRASSGVGRNFFGMGQPADRVMYDLFIGGESAQVHRYNVAGPVTNGGFTPNTWHVLILRVNEVNESLLDGLLGKLQEANIAPNPLRLGGGQFAPLNTGDNVFDICDMRLFDYPLTDDEINALRASLTKRYSLPA
jgi:hypothetical protein